MELARVTTGEEGSLRPGSDTSLQEVFDEVWVISLKHRLDRQARFWSEISKARWPFKMPVVFHAIEGNKVGVPRYWQTGGGSYGCLRSHLSILEQAIMDDARSILVLEDDAVFMASFSQDVAAFLAHVPDDWECLMLGGQHVNSQPIPVSSGIVRAGGGGGIQRTHCYALRGPTAMKALYGTWANAAVHCDWVMGPCMAKFKTYAPEPFLVGQSEGRSDVSGGQNPAKFWRPPNGMEPVVILHAAREVMEGLKRSGFHGGHTRDPSTGIDVGLRDLFTDAGLSGEQRQKRLKKWIDMIQWEVASMAGPAVCTIWHPDVTADMVHSLVPGRVIEVRADTVDEALAQVPRDIHDLPREVIRVVLLRASRETMEELRTHGWHSGYWRDTESGVDNGVRQLFAATRDKTARALGIQSIARTLHIEALQIPGGVATLWHDDITLEMLDGQDIKALEIVCETTHQALAQLSEWKDEGPN